MTGKQIKEIRLKYNLTQSAFGNLLGYADGSSKVRISELENGKIRITATIAKLAAYIDKFGPIE